jgi:hypothetical protein
MNKVRKLWLELKENKVDFEEILITVAKKFTEFRFCSQCYRNAVHNNRKLGEQEDKCYKCGYRYFTNHVFYKGIIKTEEEVENKLIFHYDTGSTNMGEYSWGMHITPVTEGLKLGRIGTFSNKDGNYYTREINTKPVLPFKKGTIVFKQWWYLWNEEKSPNFYVYDIDL